MSLAEIGPADFSNNLPRPEVSLLLTRVSDFLTEQGIKSYLVFDKKPVVCH